MYMKIYQALLIASLSVTSLYAQPASEDTTRRLLVVSGGGARGAWGVGVVEELIKDSGSYQAVFGTSTGSLMAPLILLKDTAQLAEIYTHVTQSDIFSKNPFSVKVNPTTGAVTTSLNFWAVLRFIFGSKTFGKTENLRRLIRNTLTQARYDSLLQLYHQQGMVVAVAVTNTRTGDLQLRYDSEFTTADHDKFCDWIWASANEPLFMSYVPMGDTSYVDGGLREVVPIQNGLIYAIDHDISNIDIVVNNARVPINQNWNVDSGGIMNGLERVLDIYDYGTVHYNETYARLLAAYFNAVGALPNQDARPMIRHLDSLNNMNADTAVQIRDLRRYLSGQTQPPDTANRRQVHLNFYFMPQDIAQKYPNELGFLPGPMQTLYQAGLQYGSAPRNRVRLDFDKQTVQQNRNILTQ